MRKNSIITLYCSSTLDAFCLCCFSSAAHIFSSFEILPSVSFINVWSDLIVSSKLSFNFTGSKASRPPFEPPPCTVAATLSTKFTGLNGSWKWIQEKKRVKSSPVHGIVLKLWERAETPNSWLVLKAEHHSSFCLISALLHSSFTLIHIWI